VGTTDGVIGDGTDPGASGTTGDRPVDGTL